MATGCAPDATVVTEGALSDTKQRILDAAERLFGEEGFDGTSMRAVTAAADVNLAAVNYHFGSKAALLDAVVGRILGPATERQLRRLDELEQGPGEATVEELLEAFLVPIFHMLEDEGERGPVIAQLFGRIMGDPGTEMRGMILKRVARSDRRFQDAFARALTHLPPAERWWRFRSTVALAVSHQVHHARLAEVQDLIDVPPDVVQAGHDQRLAWILTFLAGALRAPATEAVGHSAGAALEPPLAAGLEPA
jgi:AcrR family transcriptional regulator